MDGNKNPLEEDESKFLEQNYYKDGFVPAVKALSNLTKSVHDLNQTKDDESEK